MKRTVCCENTYVRHVEFDWNLLDREERPPYPPLSDRIPYCGRQQFSCKLAQIRVHVPQQSVWYLKGCFSVKRVIFTLTTLLSAKPTSFLKRQKIYVVRAHGFFFFLFFFVLARGELIARSKHEYAQQQQWMWSGDWAVDLQRYVWQNMLQIAINSPFQAGTRHLFEKRLDARCCCVVWHWCACVLRI